MSDYEITLLFYLALVVGFVLGICYCIWAGGR